MTSRDYASNPKPAFVLGDSINRVASPDSFRHELAEYRGGPSPTPSHGSGRRLSKRDLIRSRNPPPRHVSKLEPIGGRGEKARKAHAQGNDVRDESDGLADQPLDVTTDIGILADADYDDYLLPPVAWLRRQLVSSLRWESKLIASHQAKVRRPFWDYFFVYTSLFGTHSFFLIFLPTTFWLGDEVFARGLVNALAFGVYISSAIKDLFCVPRPYSPPVTRLTVGSVHLEYGFLSTHSTNSVGMAVYIYLWVLHLRSNPQTRDFDTSPFQSYIWEFGLAAYALSVVYGRIYAGMHSIVDCLSGSLLGAAISLAQWIFFGPLESFLSIPGWTVPLVVIPACLFMVYVHPEPLDDCPCFEDAIAFIAVVQGVSLGRWASARWRTLSLDQSSSPYPAVSETQQGLTALSLKVIAVIAGVFCILLVRIAVKTGCKLVLPSVFRFVDRTFGLVLPRRHYVPSSDYDNVPLDNLLRSPSIVDLPSSLTPLVTPGNNSTRLSVPSAHLHPRYEASTSSGIHARLSGSESQDSTQLSNRRLPGTHSRGSSGHSPSAEDAWSISRPDSPSSWSDDSMADLSADHRRASSSSPAQRLTQTLGGSMAGSHSFREQFPPGPSSSLSVPLTHASSQGGAELLSDKMADKVAATLSREEAQRQAVLKDPASGVKHYDVDVLTKVCVYTSIGIFASSVIPAGLSYLGWTR